MPSAAEFQQKVTKAAINMDRLDGIVNGDRYKVIETDSGAVPSMTKVLTDFRTDAETALAGYGDVGSAVGAAQQSAGKAEAAAELAVASADRFVGDKTAVVAEIAKDPSYPAVFAFRDYVAGSTYHTEVIAKAGSNPVLSVFAPGNINYDSKFDLDAGTYTGSDANMASLGNGYYSCRQRKTAATDHTTSLQIGTWRTMSFPPGGYPGEAGRGTYIARIREWRDGVLVLDADADDIAASPPWLRQDVSVTVNSDERYAPLDQQIDGMAALLGLPSRVPARPLAGLRLTTLGSSITLRNPGDPTYATELAAMSGMVLTNLGRSGGSLGVAIPSHEGSEAIYNKCLEVLPNSQLILLESGPNDFYTGVPLGSLGDTTTATYYGALDAAMIRLNNRAPDTPVCLVTPFGADSRFIEYSAKYGRPDGKMLWQFQQAIFDTGARYGVPVIDIGREGGIGWFTADTLTTDGLHPNLFGARLNARYAYDRLLEMLRRGYIRL